MVKPKKRRIAIIQSSSSEDESTGRTADNVKGSTNSKRLIYTNEPLIKVNIPVDRISKELVDINLSNIDVTIVPRTVMNEQIMMLKDSCLRSCLFQLLVKDCPGHHRNTLSMIKCVTKAIDYNPLNCWFCHKVGSKAAFSNLEDLRKHQNVEHIIQVKDLNEKFAFFEIKNRKKEATVKTYIRVRDDTFENNGTGDDSDISDGNTKLKRTVSWFERRISSKNQPKEWKRNLFCTEFGYAPFVCKLCDQNWIKKGNSVIFAVAIMSDEGKNLCRRHMATYHKLSYEKFPHVNYWFDSKNGKIIQLERLYQNLQNKYSSNMATIKEGVYEELLRGDYTIVSDTSEITVEDNDHRLLIENESSSAVKPMAEEILPVQSPPTSEEVILKRAYRCGICDVMFRSMKHYKLHQKEKHPNKTCLCVAVEVTINEYNAIH